MMLFQTRSIVLGGALVVLIFSCKNPRLPILGERFVTENKTGGSDTTYPVIADFSFIDQDSNVVSNRSFSNKVYVADFVFLSCPAICPKMTREMQKVYKRYAGDDRVALLSHTIDPAHDTVGRLRKYTKDLNISTAKWHFVTGNADSIFKIAKESYYSTVYPDSADPGNFIHSGGLLLVDRNRHVRGVYDGTDPAATQRLIGDIQILLKEQF